MLFYQSKMWENLFYLQKISKQLKLSEQTAEGTAETTQNTVIQDCLRFM